MRGLPARKGGWFPAVLYALVLHAVIVAVLVVGFRIVHRDDAPGEVMQAVVVREPPAEQEQARQEEERKQQEAEQQRIAEEQRRQQEQERARIEAERKKEEEEKKRQEAERKKKEEAAERKKREEERKKAEKQRQQQAEQALRDLLEEEEKTRTAARNVRLSSEIAKYKAAIAQRVSRHWVRPITSRKGLKCTIQVRQAPGGDVLDARVVRSSGDAAFDRSVESAVYKASPLPLPANPDVFDRDIEFEFIGTEG